MGFSGTKGKVRGREEAAGNSHSLLVVAAGEDHACGARSVRRIFFKTNEYLLISS